MKYFRDVDKGRIVRVPEEGMHLEYIFKGASDWILTEYDHPYEREYWLGEGNTCLFDISEEDALKIISSWSDSEAQFRLDLSIPTPKNDYLLYAPPVRNPEEVLKQVKKGFGYGIKHPQKIQGYAGAVLTLPEVHIDRALFDILTVHPEFKVQLHDILVSISKEDYGYISDDDRDNNGEQRWLCGTYNFVVARFHTDFGTVEFECENNMASLTLSK